MSEAELFVKKMELKSHIRSLFNHYGECDLDFVEYVDGVLSHGIESALICFRDLAKKMVESNGKDSENANRLPGMSDKLASPKNNSDIGRERKEGSYGVAKRPSPVQPLRRGK